MKHLKLSIGAGFVVLLLSASLSLSKDVPEEIKQQLSFGVKAAREDHWDEAIYRWQKVLQTDSDNLMAHNNLAVAYEQLGEYALAMEEYQLAYRLNSESEVVKNNLERFKEFYRKYQQRQKQ
jgi:Flp pilus assembly protein TadD